MRVESRQRSFIDTAKKIGPAVLLAGALGHVAIKPAEAVAIPDKVDATVCTQMFQSRVNNPGRPGYSMSTTINSYTTPNGDRALHQSYNIRYDNGNTINGKFSYFLSDTLKGPGLVSSSIEQRNGYFSSARGVVAYGFPSEQVTEVFHVGKGLCSGEQVIKDVFTPPTMHYEETQSGNTASETIKNINAVLSGIK